VYEAVLRVMKAATAMMVEGTIWNEYHDEVGKVMDQRTDWPGFAG
jgi:Xaa-Pro aminopeptidase